MRRGIRTFAAAETESKVDLTPLIGVVFILLIFFVVTASVVRETGIKTIAPPKTAAIITEAKNIAV